MATANTSIDTEPTVQCCYCGADADVVTIGAAMFDIEVSVAQCCAVTADEDVPE